jgi:outer membrane autotransporter protein
MLTALLKIKGEYTMKIKLMFTSCVMLLIFMLTAGLVRAQDINVLSQAAHLNSAMFKFGSPSLNRRMGDLRRADRGASAVWADGFYNDYSKSGDITIDARFWGVEGGVDIEVSGGLPNRLYLGLMAGYMESISDVKISDERASKKDAFWAGLYGIWLNDNGWFAAFKTRSYSPESKVYSMENTSADWNMLSFTLEGGKEFKFDMNKHSFFALEPKLLLSYGHTGGEKIFYDNTYSLTFESMNVMFGRAGLTASFASTFGGCGVLEPFVEGGYNRDFSPNAKVKDTDGESLSVKLSGGSWDAGGGLTIIFNEKLSFHAYGG